MMNMISSAIGQSIAAGSALVGYLSSASAFFVFASFQPLSSVCPMRTTTFSAVPAGRSVDVNDSPDLVRKSFALSHSLNVDHGPTKMWKLQSRACTEIGLAFWNDSRAGFT